MARFTYDEDLPLNNNENVEESITPVTEEAEPGIADAGETDSELTEMEESTHVDENVTVDYPPQRDDLENTLQLLAQVLDEMGSKQEQFLSKVETAIERKLDTMIDLLEFRSSDYLPAAGAPGAEGNRRATAAKVPLDVSLKKWLRVAAVSSKVLSAVCENLENFIDVFAKAGKQGLDLLQTNTDNSRNKIDLYDLLTMLMKELPEKESS